MDLQMFNNPRFGEVRTVEEGGKVLFCGNDIAKALGYKSPKDAIAAHCKGAVKRRLGVQTGTKADGTPAMQEVEMTFIPEGDIYRLAARSKLPGADEFERWIFDEVLPSIRRNGAYMTSEVLERTLTDPDYLIGLATALKEEQKKRKALEEKVKADAPAVFFAESITGAETNILVRDLAKLLVQNGANIGGNRLFEILRRDGYLIKSGSDYNMPTQKSMELGLFFVRETPRISKDGAVIDRTTKVTPKGQKYFINKYATQKALAKM